MLFMFDFDDNVLCWDTDDMTVERKSFDECIEYLNSGGICENRKRARYLDEYMGAKGMIPDFSVYDNPYFIRTGNIRMRFKCGAYGLINSTICVDDDYFINTMHFNTSLWIKGNPESICYDINGLCGVEVKENKITLFIVKESKEVIQRCIKKEDMKYEKGFGTKMMKESVL